MIAGVIGDVTSRLEDFSAEWWFLLVIFGVALIDSVFPIVPSETLVIVGGVAAGQGNQAIGFVIAAGAVGAFLGDNLAYAIGHRFSAAVDRWADRKAKRRARLDAAGRQIRRRGGLLLITARFVPGGRTILTLSCGITRQRRLWFVAWIAVAATIWATYASLLGYFFGQVFEDDHTLAFLVALGAALSITALIELVRWLRNRGAQPDPAA